MPELSTIMIVDCIIVGFGMQFFSSATIMLDQRDNSSFLGGSLLSSSSFLVSFKAVEAWDVGSLNPSSVAAASKAIMMAFSIEQEKDGLNIMMQLIAHQLTMERYELRGFTLNRDRDFGTSACGCHFPCMQYVYIHIYAVRPAGQGATRMGCIRYTTVSNPGTRSIISMVKP